MHLRKQKVPLESAKVSLYTININNINMSYFQVERREENLFDEKCMFCTFSANEVIDCFRQVLDDNLQSKATQDRIIHEIRNELIHHVWRIRLNSIVDNIQKSITQQKNDDSLISKSYEELNDVLALLQMLGGIDPIGAKKNNIKHDFLSALSFLSLMIRQFAKSWHNLTNNSQLRTVRNKILTDCFKTFTDIINVNVPYFDSVDSVQAYLGQAIEFDNGIIGKDLYNEIQELYDTICVDTFRLRLNQRQLTPVIKSAERLHVDIMDAIEQIPNDSRKFQILCQNGKNNEQYSEALYKCACESDDVDTIVQFLKMIKDKDKFKPVYFKKLGETLNSWLNELLLHSLSQSITSDSAISKAYQTFRRCIEPLSPGDKKKLFSVVNGTDIAQALYSLVKKGVIDLTRDDPMTRDLKEILSSFKQN